MTFLIFDDGVDLSIPDASFYVSAYHSKLAVVAQKQNKLINFPKGKCMNCLEPLQPDIVLLP